MFSNRKIFSSIYKDNVLTTQKSEMRAAVTMSVAGLQNRINQHIPKLFRNKQTNKYLPKFFPNASAKEMPKYQRFSNVTQQLGFISYKIRKD